MVETGLPTGITIGSVRLCRLPYAMGIGCDTAKRDPPDTQDAHEGGARSAMGDVQGDASGRGCARGPRGGQGPRRAAAAGVQARAWAPLPPTGLEAKGE